MLDSNYMPVGLDADRSVRSKCICQKEVWIGFLAADGEPIALHEMPACQLYLDLDLDEYAARIREFMGN